MCPDEKPLKQQGSDRVSSEASREEKSLHFGSSQESTLSIAALGLRP